MNRFVEVGQAMWQMLADTFQHVMRENSAAYHADKAKVWAGFMSAATGAMARDLGPDDARTVLHGVLGALDVVTAQETRAGHETSLAQHKFQEWDNGKCRCGAPLESAIHLDDGEGLEF